MSSLFNPLTDQTLPQIALLAYVGPGAGLTMLGALVAVGGIILLAILAPLLYPLRAIRGWIRQRSMNSSDRVMSSSFYQQVSSVSSDGSDQ